MSAAFSLFLRSTCWRCDSRINASSDLSFSFFAEISASRRASASRTCPAMRSFSFWRSDCRYATCLSIIRCRIACLLAEISASRSARSFILRSFSSAKNWIRFSSSSRAWVSVMRFSSRRRLFSFMVMDERLASSLFLSVSACFSAWMKCSTRILMSWPSRRSSSFPPTYRCRNSSSWSSWTCFACSARCIASSCFCASSASPFRTPSTTRSCHRRSSAFVRSSFFFFRSICISRSFITSDRYSLLPNALTRSVFSYSSVFARWMMRRRSPAWNDASSRSCTCRRFSSSSCFDACSFSFCARRASSVLFHVPIRVRDMSRNVSRSWSSSDLMLCPMVLAACVSSVFLMRARSDVESTVVWPIGISSVAFACIDAIAG
mmetsp:Transcript_16322/g.39438  ORF Transcript_16322/g.39438 Transcript_16322/m.39438 type:complete len:377 (-) Transcript_16322:118-1248(-)